MRRIGRRGGGGGGREEGVGVDGGEQRRTGFGTGRDKGAGRVTPHTANPNPMPLLVIIIMTIGKLRHVTAKDGGSRKATIARSGTRTPERTPDKGRAWRRDKRGREEMGSHPRSFVTVTLCPTRMIAAGLVLCYALLAPRQQPLRVCERAASVCYLSSPLPC